jgi:hypothetical protein
MTALLGGSLLLIAVSAASLVYGWINGEDTFVWTSIAATAGAAALVVVAYVRSSKEPVAAPSTSPGPPATSPPDEQPTTAQPAAEERATQGQPVADPGDAAAAAAPAAAASTTGGDAAEAETSEAGSGDSATQQVVGIPKTKKFHKPECRFASAEGAETMTRADAETKGFSPCGVCKP